MEDDEDEVVVKRKGNGRQVVISSDDEAADVGNASKGKKQASARRAPAKRKRMSEDEDGGGEDIFISDDEEYDSDLLDDDSMDYEPDRMASGSSHGASTSAPRKRGRGMSKAAKGAQDRLAAGMPQALRSMNGDEEDDDGAWRDFRHLQLKDDHSHRPLWVTPDGHIFLETFSPVYKQAYDFLIAIAEPISRPETLHEYQLTVHSLYAAVSVGLTRETVITVLNRLSKNVLAEELKDFIYKATQNYGKVKLVLQRNKFWVESPDVSVLRTLKRDAVFQAACVPTPPGAPEFATSSGKKDEAARIMAQKMENIDLSVEGLEAAKADGNDEDAEDEATGAAASGRNKDVTLYSFEVQGAHVEHVKQRCLPGGLNFPMLEEYDFRNDTVNSDIPYELKPVVKHRPYQEKGLAKMFGNGRARSGIIVLPCGAGKSLTGISAAVRVKKSCLVLVTNAVSVDQWRHQFKLWTTVQDHNIGRFTSADKDMFSGKDGVMICTYSMIAGSNKKRSKEGQRVFDLIAGREWGLILLDEVHVVPAEMFRKVIGIIKSHCKLGLTATLVREDSLITDLNFLIGPKLYEANWLDLTRAGHIANVQCCEVWCPMTKEFYNHMLREPAPNKRYSLSVMNPNKFRSCEFLIRYHEEHRNDKIIVFSDNIFALKEYAVRMRRPFLYGGTSHRERTKVLSAFKNSTTVNTVFLSKVGDNSLDIPEANVLIQISSHAGSRRQEAQRLGRILRAKREKPGANHSEFNAFFYTLVSKDTQEMFFSTKRQRFLVDQGYSFKVVTNLLDAAGDMTLQLKTTAEELDLLAKVIASNEAAEDIEKDLDEDGIPGRVTIHRKKGTLKEHTGANANYKEFGKKPAPTGPWGGDWRKMVRKRGFLGNS